ncbi:MAG: DUF3293 domain-containing protein [Saprospiraceae bacterium]
MDNSYGNIDQSLLKAYEETIYQVLEPPISIQINMPNADLAAFLRAHDARTWAFITAWNPKSQLLSPQENNQRHTELVKRIKKGSYPFFLGKGIGKDANWEPEVSLFVLHISKMEALQVGRYFEQNAIVFGERDGLPTLLFINNTQEI